MSVCVCAHTFLLFSSHLSLFQVLLSSRWLQRCINTAVSRVLRESEALRGEGEREKDKGSDEYLYLGG